MKSTLLKFVPVIGLSLIVIAISVFRPSRAVADPAPRMHAAAILVFQEDGQGLSVYVSSVSVGIKPIAYGTPAAQAIADLLNQGVTIKKMDGVLFTFTD